MIPKHREARLLVFDIEATNLKADFGFVLCVSWKYVGENKVNTLRIDKSPNYRQDPINDSWILEKFAKVYNDADVVIGHYTWKFDRKFINARLMRYGLAPLVQTAFVDTWRTSHDHLALSSNRLASIVSFFGLPEKTPLRGDTWLRAMCGHKPSISKVVEHCEADILATEAAYLKLRPLMTTHPNINLVTGREMLCPRCSSGNIIKNGFRIARSRVTQRYACKDCGGSSLGSPIKVMEVDAR